MHGAGCDKCRGSGYAGRAGIFELLIVDDEFRDIINKDSSVNSMRAAFVKSGRDTLFDDGIKKVQKGITTIEEVLRVTQVTGRRRTRTRKTSAASGPRPNRRPKAGPRAGPRAREAGRRWKKRTAVTPRAWFWCLTRTAIRRDIAAAAAERKARTSGNSIEWTGAGEFMINVKKMLAASSEHGASDVHVNVAMPPIMASIRTGTMDMPPVNNEERRDGPDDGAKRNSSGFSGERDLDFSTDRRRQPPVKPLPARHSDRPADLQHIPQIESAPAADCQELTIFPRLVLVRPHGLGQEHHAGVDDRVINQKYKKPSSRGRPRRIRTGNNTCMIEQREVGSDCTDFAWLKHVLRQDPDIILVGEILTRPPVRRSPETGTWC